MIYFLEVLGLLNTAEKLTASFIPLLNWRSGHENASQWGGGRPVGSLDSRHVLNSR